jgi:DNA ligase-1
MHNSTDVIEELQATNSRLEKEQILVDAWISGCKDFFQGAMLCYDPFITFGVAEKMVPKKTKPASDPTAIKNKHSDFVSLAMKLKDRLLTGNAAREEIEKFIDNTDANDWNLFYRPILLKDLRCGLSETTINKVLQKLGGPAKNYVIKTFECQLAKDGAEETFEGKVILQEKLDGVRLIVFCDLDKKEVIMYTRNGKENNNFPHIKKVFEDALPGLKTSMVFDGEIVGANFQSVMTQVNRKDNVNTKNDRLALFDCLTLSDFKREISEITQLQRIEMLDSFSLFSDKSEQSPVFKLESLIVDMTTDKGKKDFDLFNQKAIAAGKEGIMVKKPDAPYECKRSKSWLKIKPTIAVSLPIISMEEGTGKYAGSLGAFVCEGVDSSYPDKTIKVNVGSGLTDEQRKDFWKKRGELLGFIIEIKADIISKNDDTKDETFSLRFPRFVGFRGSLPGEKI